MTSQITNYENDYQIIRTRVYQSQNRAFQAVNKELISLYWDLGKVIAEKQEAEEWGKSTVERLAKDLQGEFVGVSGFSTSNLWYMRQFYIAYRDTPKLQPLAGVLAGISQTPAKLQPQMFSAKLYISLPFILMVMFASVVCCVIVCRSSYTCIIVLAV